MSSTAERSRWLLQEGATDKARLRASRPMDTEVAMIDGQGSGWLRRTLRHLRRREAPTDSPR